MGYTSEARKEMESQWHGEVSWKVMSLRKGLRWISVKLQEHSILQ